MPTPWPQTPVHVLDFEGHARYGIVEWGVVTLHDGRITTTATGICAPEKPLDPREAAFHQLRPQVLAAAPPFADQWPRFRDLRATGLLAAHHAPVESGLLQRLWPHPPFSPAFVEADRVATWGPWIDTLHLARARLGPRPDYGLTACLEHLDLSGALGTLAAQHCPSQRARAHCALYDALGAALLLLTLAPPDDDLEKLLALSATPRADGGQTELGF